MIKKRARPQPRIREEPFPDGHDENEDDDASVSELLDLMRMRKQRKGIDVLKLSSGDARRRRRKVEEEEEEVEDVGGLRAGTGADPAASKTEVEVDDMADAAAKARRAVRTNNFTQQTNALDVDKHMMAYIEENLRRRQHEDAEEMTRDVFALSERWKTERRSADEGSVTNSMAMLTAIPEVDLGIDSRLRNIEETEKAKRMVAEERKERKKFTDEEHLVATRFYRPHIKQRSDAEIMREARMEAMGLPAQEERRSRHDKPQMATDELVMERFKKRMRR